jgi:hypothetical protein
MITYKNITDIEALNEMPDGAKVMINDSGELKQTALDLKALDYNNLTKVEAIEELPENAKVLVNDGGKLKQVACEKMGGSANGGRIIISEFDEDGETKYSANCTVMDLANMILDQKNFPGITYVKYGGGMVYISESYMVYFDDERIIMRFYNLDSTDRFDMVWYSDGHIASPAPI